MQTVELLAYCQYFAHFLVAMETFEGRRIIFIKLNVYKKKTSSSTTKTTDPITIVL